jgi:hypothetical protein
VWQTILQWGALAYENSDASLGVAAGFGVNIPDDDDTSADAAK